MGKLINRILGLRLLISNLTGLALRTLISKDTHLVFSIYHKTSRLGVMERHVYAKYGSKKGLKNNLRSLTQLDMVTCIQ